MEPENQTNPVPVASPEPSQPSPLVAAGAESRMKTFTITAIVIGVLILLGAGYYVYYLDKGDVIGTVNGTKLYQSELDESITFLRNNPSLYGLDQTSPNFEAGLRERAVEALVNNALLTTAAKASGFTADEAATEEAYQAIVLQAGGEEALRSEMAAVGFTKERLVEDLAERIIIDQYIIAETDVEQATATPEEVDEFVAMLKENDVQLPEDLATVRPQIEAEIVKGKQQQIIDAFLERLRSEATIEMNI